MRSKLFIIFLIINLLIPSIVVAEESDDTALIKNLLEQYAGGVCQLPAGTFYISEMLEVKDGTTVKGVIGVNGDPQTKLILSESYPINLKNQLLTINSNVKIEGVWIDGNKENRDIPMWKGSNGKGRLSKNGRTYDILIYGNRVENIEISNCKFSNNAGDQIKINYAKNIRIHDNVGMSAGHENVFIRQSERVEIFNNTFHPSCNSGVRFILVSPARVYSNTIYYMSVPDGGGPGMQMQKTGGEMQDVEITGNTFINTWGCGIWVAATDSTGVGNLNIHHNVMINSGKGGTLRDGAILGNGFNVKIENNVFDSSTKAGVYTYKYKSSWPSSGTFDINSNIFVNSDGYGILNEADHTIKTSNNCFWNNAKDSVEGCSLSPSDFTNVNPRTSSTPSGWSWDGSKWSNPDVKVTPMGDITGIYDNSPEITDEQMNELEYGNIALDMLNEEFKTTAEDNETVILPVGAGEIPTDATGKVEYCHIGSEYFTRVSVPTEGLSEVRYEVKGNVTTHTLMIGEKTKEGVVFTETSIWEGEGSHDGGSLKLDGNVSEDDIKVTCITPRGEFTPDMKKTNSEFKIIKFHPASIIIVIVLLIGYWFNKKFEKLLQ